MSAPRRVLPEPSRRGWCPSLARPMPTGDGLLARIHPPLGILSPAQARAIADGARRHGNGHIDVTARANLQIRGVSDETAEPLSRWLDGAGLGDVRDDGGPQRLTLTAPLAPPEVMALAATIEAIGLGIPGLPAKTIVIVTSAIPGIFPGRAEHERSPVEEVSQRRCSGAMVQEPLARPILALDPGSSSAHAANVREGGAGLSETEADLRVVVVAPGRVALALADSEWFAEIDADRVPDVVAGTLHALVGSGQRRMRDIPAEERAKLAASLGLQPGPMSLPARSPSAGLTPLSDGRTAILLDAPFGRLTASALDRLADRAEAMGSDIHLAPSRGFALVASDGAAARGARDALAFLFITEPDDPRGSIAACPGAPACASGSTPTLVDAARLAQAFRPFAAMGLSAHVSGCAKGCAHPGAASLTLVGRDGLYGIVIGGRPDTLPATLLTFDAALERVRRADPTHHGNLADALAHAFRTPT
ncbi:hypothetical protein [Methylobacterium marchantiae]|uniref:Nitrite/Sulfite reductase ferredoxin-like domain-containing protein n=1 Tax=Methylobacterium marchantiae TaxID=600331 RepID=A0ABW3WV52_9HYPH|nr:hypothetical protein AIGOOFII_2518 [Methylobacterium marchantiae]